MINPESFRFGPGKPKIFPTLTDEQVKTILHGNIRAAQVVTKETANFAESISDRIVSSRMFSMNAEPGLSPVLDQKGQVGLFEKGQFQKIAFQVMSEYGLDIMQFTPEYSNTGGWNSEGSLQYKDGTSREILRYPSKTVPGLFFVRWRDYYTQTKEPIFVSWSVEGHKKPFRNRVLRLLDSIRGNQPQPQILT